MSIEKPTLNKVEKPDRVGPDREPRQHLNVQRQEFRCQGHVRDLDR